MPLSYEEIKKGRRRDWEKLRDPEEVRAEKKAAKEADPNYKKRHRSFMEIRDERYQQSLEDDQKKWRKTKRDSILLIAGMVLVIFLWNGLTFLAGVIKDRGMERKLDSIQEEVASGAVINDLSDPFHALGTWRSGWVRRDAESVYRSYSLRRQGMLRSKRTEDFFLRDFQKQINEGRMDLEMSVGVTFTEIEVVQMPSEPFRQGDLAVFRSEVHSDSEPTATEEPWVVAFTYEEPIQQWRLDEIRPTSYWRDNWEYAGQAQMGLSKNYDSGSGW